MKDSIKVESYQKDISFTCITNQKERNNFWMSLPLASEINLRFQKLNYLPHIFYLALYSEYILFHK